MTAAQEESLEEIVLSREELDTKIVKLLDKYILAKGCNRKSYFIDRSGYVRDEGLNPGTVCNWLSKKKKIPLKHLKGFVEELDIPKSELIEVCGEDPFELSDERLETLGKDKKGVGRLFEFYVDLNHGIPFFNYLRSSSYLQSNKLVAGSVIYWFNGDNPFPLKHLSGFQKELGVPQEELEKVCGSNPFKPTEDELEEWSEEKRVGKLLEFYIDLKYGASKRKYIKELSNYSKVSGKRPKGIGNWFIGSVPFPIKHLKGFVDELEVPQEELEQVCGRNPFKPTEEELEEWSEGNLLSFYVKLRDGVTTNSYIKNCDLVKSGKINYNTLNSWWNGNNRFILKYLKHFVDELEVPGGELEHVCGRDPFTPTADELEEWSREKRVGKLFSFYIDLHYGITVKSYLEDHSKYREQEGISLDLTADLFYGEADFPPEHLKGFADELGIPPEYVKRVSGIDVTEVRSAGEELGELLGGFLDE